MPPDTLDWLLAEKAKELRDIVDNPKMKSCRASGYVSHGGEVYRVMVNKITPAQMGRMRDAINGCN